VDSVFTNPVYNRSISDTLWRRIFLLISNWLKAIFNSINELPLAKWIVLAVGSALLITIVVRAAYLSRTGNRTRAMVRGKNGIDHWNASSQAAASGRYVEAAHLLYLALIDTIADRERLRLHPAKTIGDYSRDLRRSSSSALPAFREFAHLYQPIVWGSSHCDAQSYERLHSIAESVRDAA
jgi:hypothetical protein